MPLVQLSISIGSVPRALAIVMPTTTAARGAKQATVAIANADMGPHAVIGV